jgi:octaheme c-type cytochrome (tetrathionate reductase family)
MDVLEKLKNHRFFWLGALLITLLVIAVPILIYLPRAVGKADDPWVHLPTRKPHTDHTPLMSGPYESGSDVTRRCLECHQDAAVEFMQTVHWTWESKPYDLEGYDEPVTIGKKNQLNNFCIGIQSNWESCTACHAGYGWDSADFNFTAQENVDCLVCHDQSGLYAKGNAGLPLEEVDLAVAAQSVGYPSRVNCGACHFNGGGGNAVKHGDMDEHLYYPSEDLDVHMGRYDFQCIDCHTGQEHEIRGRAISVSLDLENQVACTDCHNSSPHSDQRLNSHVESIACQTCHIPVFGTGDPTKMAWDWSAAGQDREDDPHEYLKMKGSFVYEGNVTPEYYWFSGVADRYLLGEPRNPTGPTLINTLAGDMRDPQAKIWPFKVHRALQPYDPVNNYLLQPMTAGEGGYWDTFDWADALTKGSQVVGLDFSGQYGFAETWMYWTISHSVKPAKDALQCSACHGDRGRLDWQGLGYPGDPARWGGRFSSQP